MSPQVKRERQEVVTEAEDQEELSGHLVLEVDQRQGYEDRLKAQIRAAGEVPLSRADYRAQRA